MAMHGSKGLKIEFDSTQGGSLVDISNQVISINGMPTEAIVEEGTAFGDEWVEQLFTGVKQAGVVNLVVFFDDTASTGSHAVFSPIGETRTLKLTWGTTVTSSVETIIQSYAPTPALKGMTKANVALQSTGALTWA